MPIRPFLGDQAFDQEAITTMSQAAGKALRHTSTWSASRSNPRLL